MKQPIVVGIGELLWDLLPSGKRAGGAPINFVYHAAQLGATGYAISAVGKDALGAEIIQELKTNRIHPVLSTVDYPTGTVPVVLKDGLPAYTIVEDVAWDHLPFNEKAVDILRRADAVCYGTLALRHPDTRATIFRLLSEVRSTALFFFDINLREAYYSKELIERLLQPATVFKLNDDEIKVMRRLFALTGTDDDICQKLLDKYHLDYLIFTAGEKYSVVYTPAEKSFIETPVVSTVDTVGAGDAFSGAFVYSLLTGKSLRQAHEKAVAVSAYVCTQSGAWPPYKDFKS